MKTNELIKILRDESNPNVLDYIDEAADALEAQQKRIEELEAERTKPLTAFLSPIDVYKGLKRKFLVFKSDTGEIVENCFVLRPDKDPAAVEALRAYARTTDNATLSADIVNWVGEGQERRWIPVTERLPNLILCDADTAYSEAVNVLTSGRKVLTAIWDGFDWACDAEYWDAEDEEITHWTPVLLPLPKPPKGE